MTEKNFPAVSIIVPMYNVEKYISETLDSILAQTFTDYELIVVDDCSTDKSCEIVESYIPKFENRLRLIKSKMQSGGRPGIPRNIALDLANGEYVMFVDSDDVITPTALEELYPIAKKFDADLLVTQRFYEAPEKFDLKDERSLEIFSEGWDESELIKEPALMSENLADRVEYCGFKKIFPAILDRLFRRELLVKHDIKFPDFRAGEDFVFNFFVLCLAKNIVLVPNIFYVWRQVQNSITRGEGLTPKKLIDRWAESALYGIPLLNKFMDNFDLFREKAEYKYLIFEMLSYYHLWHVLELYKNIPDVKLGSFMPSAEVDKIIRPLLNKVEDKTTLLTVFFNRMNFFQIQRHDIFKQNKKMQEEIALLKKQIQELQN